MKNQPVVVAFLAQLEEVLARFRGVQVIQFQFERAEGGLEEDGRGAGRVVLRVESRFVRLLVVVVAAHSYAVRFFRVGVAIARECCVCGRRLFFLCVLVLKNFLQFKSCDVKKKYNDAQTRALSFVFNRKYKSDYICARKKTA